jgi:hypothetical protein
LSVIARELSVFDGFGKQLIAVDRSGREAFIEIIRIGDVVLLSRPACWKKLSSLFKASMMDQFAPMGHHSYDR